MWGVKNGILRLHVDDNVVFRGQTAQQSKPFPGGSLVLGQSQDSSGSIIDKQSLKADIMHFNMWEHMFSEAEAMDLHSDCRLKLGNLVPWPEIQIAIHGNVTRTTFVGCPPKGMTYLHLKV